MINKKITYSFLIFILAFYSKVFSICLPPVLPPPELRCVSVDINGNVILSWQAVTNIMSSFDSYHIFTSTSAAGPYSDIVSITNINQTTYTHTGANANNQSVYYYIETESAGSVYSPPSDTLQTILLHAVVGVGAASLTWNPIHNPNLTSSYGWYHIYMQHPPASWVLIDSTQSLSYVDSATFCHAHINYYVGIDDSLPCTSISSIASVLFQDQIAPVTPVIDSVSVDPLSQHDVIGWTASPSGDTQGYIIYENEHIIWIPIDTVYGINNTYYVNSHSYWSNPDSSSFSYCVAAFDSCLNTSPLDLSQSTIFLTSKLEVCSDGVTLNWTPYANMNPALMCYKIYMQINGGPITLLATNPSTNQSYYHSPLLTSATYVYTIRAFDSTGTVTSTSNADTVHAYAPPQPQFVYMRYVTVRKNSYVELKAIIDTSGNITTCNIMRAEDSMGPFILIGTIIPPHFSNTITFIDSTANPQKKTYYYDIVLADTCGNHNVTSNLGSTIFLQAAPTADMTNVLTWNEYTNWLVPIGAYVIYRKIDEVLDPTPIATLLAGTTSYTDDVSSFTQTDGKFEYYLVAIEDAGNPYSIIDTSTSNETQALQPPRYYVPDAFVPKGKNNIFIPINAFINAEDYQLSIYNRWGTLIFLTNDISTGWNGTYQGKLAPEGAYAYSIRYLTTNNVYFEKRGTVTLIR